MKTIKICFMALLMTIGFSSCQSVHVATDYDKTVNFNQFKTFAFYKPGIDRAKISDLDKRRILRAIDTALTAQGLRISKKPDLLVSISTNSTKNVNVNSFYYGWGAWGWGPWHWGYGPRYGGFGFGYYNPNTAYVTTEGKLYINLIRASDKTLVWQGVGIGRVTPTGNTDEKIEHIKAIVDHIMRHYPPGKEQP